LLADGPLDTAAIAARIDLPTEGAERLLRGAAALGLVQPLGAAWALGSDGAALRGNRGIAEMVAHHHLLYTDLADPVALLRRGGGGGALSGLWHYAGTQGAGMQPRSPPIRL
jgi:demethylspheroidene O-methyltransferase